MLLMIDNYDSFTYNIVHYFREIGIEVMVKRHDEIDISRIKKLRPTYIVISPGPGNPNNSGISLTIMKSIRDTPVLGICLGHQCLGQAFGGRIIRSQNIYHGKGSKIVHNCQGIFEGLPSPFTAIRYHSLVIDKINFPETELEVTAHSEDGEVMGVRHYRFPLEGIQFHPESIGSEHGHDILRNFLNRYK